MNANSHHRQCGGFTLLELLVALTVLGFVLVGLAQGTHFGLLAWSTQARLTANVDGFSTTNDVLRHIVEGADPGTDVDPAPFIGSRDELDCITALPSSVTPTPDRRIQVALRVDAQHRLILLWRPYVHAIPIGPPPRPTETELLRGVSQVELTFWQPSGGWVSAWRSPDLPKLVRIRVLFPAGDPRHWPDIIAAPQLDRP
jgi:general secretion pathway protein J